LGIERRNGREYCCSQDGHGFSSSDVASALAEDPQTRSQLSWYEAKRKGAELLAYAGFGTAQFALVPLIAGDRKERGAWAFTASAGILSLGIASLLHRAAERQLWGAIREHDARLEVRVPTPVSRGRAFPDAVSDPQLRASLEKLSARAVGPRQGD
jgi:hypothetical protein